LQFEDVSGGRSAGDEARMYHGFLRTLVKVTIASLVVGSIMAHFGVTPDVVMRESGLSQDRVADLARRGFEWALPNLVLGSMVIVPIWFLVFLFRPPRPRSD
jgi:hypothetical protein